MQPISDTGGASVPAFLAKLWRLVEDPETNHLIYWNSDGRSFIIQNQAQFARELLPLNYKHNNMASFIRQLNMYGFHKITSLDNGGLKFDRDEMEFSHPCFQRGSPFLLENIKRKIAHARNHAEEKTVATTAQVPVVKQETLNRVLNEVKKMQGKQEVLDNRFSAMKQENEALWREVVMLRQKHMKQQQIVNKLIQFLVTIVQPSGRGNMGMKRRLPLMLNEAPSASKSRKMSGSDYGLEISSLANSDDEEEEAYINLISGDNPIVLQTKMGRPATSARGMISEIPNTPSSTRSHHDDLDDIDDIIEEEAADADVDKIFEELNEATTTTTPMAAKANQDQGPKTRSKKALGAVANGKTATNAVNSAGSQVAPTMVEASDKAEMDEFLKFNTGADSGASVVAGTSQDKATWYANKNGFVSNEIPVDLFEDHSNASMGGGGGGLQDSNVNPTLSEDLAAKIDGEAEAEGKKQGRKFTGKHLQLARLPSNNGDVATLNTPEDFTMHLDSVQTDLNALKGILSSDGLNYDPYQLAGMFDDDNVLTYQLPADCLGDLGGGGAVTSDDGNGKEATGKQMLQYNPTLDFSELLDGDDGGSSSLVPDVEFLPSVVDGNGSLNTPQPQ